MKRYIFKDDSECFACEIENDFGGHVRFEDVQQLARECIDPVTVALIEADAACDDDYLEKIQPLLARLKAIAGVE